MTFLSSIPALVLLLGALAITLAAVGIGQIFVHRCFSNQDLITHNQVGGYIIAISGALFAVLLSFLTVIVWQHVAEARRVVVQESNAVIDA